MYKKKSYVTGVIFVVSILRTSWKEDLRIMSDLKIAMLMSYIKILNIELRLQAMKMEILSVKTVFSYLSEGHSLSDFFFFNFFNMTSWSELWFFSILTKFMFWPKKRNQWKKKKTKNWVPLVLLVRHLIHPAICTHIT